MATPKQFALPAAFLFVTFIAVGTSIGAGPSPQVQARIAAESPELRSLDSLGVHYIFNAGPVSFETQRGTMVFGPEEVRVATLDADPPGNDVAWVRLGKKESTDSPLLIKDWVVRMLLAVAQAGYSALPTETGTTVYGNFVTIEFVKGDMYARCYSESIRVQGTYNSTSMAYTFYFERGSKSRSRRFDQQQYGGH